jgi:archaellum component FlaF (FlaF/FlaG flagellin family)
MANVRNANTYYIDATGSLTIQNVRVTHVIYRSTNATNNVVIKDVTTGATKLNISTVAANETLFLDFSDNPIVFPNGIDVTTVTAATATLIGRETQG